MGKEQEKANADYADEISEGLKAGLINAGEAVQAIASEEALVDMGIMSPEDVEQAVESLRKDREEVMASRADSAEDRGDALEEDDDFDDADIFGDSDDDDLDVSDNLGDFERSVGEEFEDDVSADLVENNSILDDLEEDDREFRESELDRADATESFGGLFAEE